MPAQWNEYYQKILSQPHRPSVENAVNRLKIEGKVALDIGCGIGRTATFSSKRDLRFTHVIAMKMQ